MSNELLPDILNSDFGLLQQYAILGALLFGIVWVLGLYFLFIRGSDENNNGKAENQPDDIVYEKWRDTLSKKLEKTDKRNYSPEELLTELDNILEWALQKHYNSKKDITEITLEYNLGEDLESVHKLIKRITNKETYIPYPNEVEEALDIYTECIKELASQI